MPCWLSGLDYVLGYQTTGSTPCVVHIFHIFCNTTTNVLQYCHLFGFLQQNDYITILRLIQWVTSSFRNTKVLHQTLNPAAELWCKTLCRIMFGIKPRF